MKWDWEIRNTSYIHDVSASNDNEENEIYVAHIVCNDIGIREIYVACINGFCNDNRKKFMLYLMQWNIWSLGYIYDLSHCNAVEKYEIYVAYMIWGYVLIWEYMKFILPTRSECVRWYWKIWKLCFTHDSNACNDISTY